MLITDKRTFRNLEEQVRKNKEDIAAHYEVDRVLNVWGLRVLGILNSPSEIPDMEYQYGDAYGIHSGDDIVYYVWTRENPNIGKYEDYWLNIGPIAIQGPQGLRGPVGPVGPAGIRGSIASSSSTPPLIAQKGDLWINPTNGNFYIYTEQKTWQYVVNLIGPQGYVGPPGPQGPRGNVGPIGPQGVKGDTGSSFQIAGLIASIDLLPTPTEANRHKGYAIGNSTDGYDLYVVVGDEELLWVNMGKVEGVEGPQGPIGPQGPQGPAGADIQVVHITDIPAESTQGTLTTEQVNTLLAHSGNYIQFFNENFYPQDVETDLGYIVYSHVGMYESTPKIKNIIVTIATGGWVLTETAIGGLTEEEVQTLIDNAISGSLAEDY